MTKASIDSLDRHLGQRVREFRQRNRLTIADIAHLAELSPGMLSKIENGQATASLDSLVRIANALGVAVGALFKGYGAPGGSARLIKAGEGMEVVRRGTAKGHTYHLLSYDQGPRKRFEPFLISMDDASEVFPTFEHDGTVPHGPERILEVPIRFLTVIVYDPPALE
jgi:transcriptional regulator with XRE-family HTH domain